MRIAAAETIPYAVPFRAPVATARGTLHVRRGVLLVLRGDDGTEGVGDMAPHPAAADDGGAVYAALATAAAALCGAELAGFDRLVADAGRLPAPVAMAIDMALHDLLGRATGRTVAALLGGPRRAVVPASALLDGDPLEAARRAVAAGFTVAKVKALADAAATCRQVAAIRAVAPGLALRVDANGAWDTATACSAAAALGVAWLEQPVRDIAALARVRAAGGCAVAADEAVTGPEAVAALREAAAADVLVLKLVQVGGLARARATAAAAAPLPVTVTTGLDTGIATAAALQLALALPDPLPACGVATGRLLAHDLLVEPIADGPAMRPPVGPGSGARLDRVALERFRTEAPR